MREILFRGKRIDNGEWVEGFLFYQKMDGIAVSCIGTEPIMANAFYEIGGEGIDWHEVDPFTICQCTGLTDKNGRKIWENDIVAFTDMYSTENGYAEMDCIGEVGWDSEELCFYVTDRLSAESWEVLQECYVVGNIFDNPKLMEGERC